VGFVIATSLLLSGLVCWGRIDFVLHATLRLILARTGMMPLRLAATVR
jgi:hypothetical protein